MRWSAALSGVVALLAIVAAALGVFARGDGTFEAVTSVRGETYEVATTGVYAWSAKQLVAEGVGWDLFTLIVAAPLLLVGALFVARGSFRGHLFTSGLLGYFVYLYLEYAVTWAFGPLFALFVTILGIALIAMIGTAASATAMGLNDRFDRRFPGRQWAALSIAMSALLIVMWTALIAQGLSGDVDRLLHGETTLTVQALDLGIMVPITLLVAGATLLRHPTGMAVAGAWVVTFTTMSGAIAAMMVSASVVTGALQLPPLVIFGAACVGGIAIGTRMYTSAAPRRRDARDTAGTLQSADLPAAG